MINRNVPAILFPLFLQAAAMAADPAPPAAVKPVTLSGDSNTLILLRFNEGQGDMVRDYGRKKDMYALKGHKWIEPKLKYGIDLGKNNLKIENKNLSGLTGITIEGYVKWKGSNGEKQYLFYLGNTGKNGFGIILDEKGKIGLRIGGRKEIMSEKVLMSGEWTHLAVTAQEGVTSLYLNNVRILEFTQAFFKPDDIFTLSSNSAPLNGGIGEVRISDIPREFPQIPEKTVK